MDISSASHTTLDASYRSHVDLSLCRNSVFGNKFQTSPVIFKVSDQALWLYEKNLLLPVVIKEYTPPALWCHQPTYHIKFADHKGSHDCNHDNIFIHIGATDILDPNILLKANMESLRIGDQLCWNIHSRTTKLVMRSVNLWLR